MILTTNLLTKCSEPAAQARVFSQPLLANIMRLLSVTLVKKEFALHLVISTLQGEFSWNANSGCYCTR